MDVTVEIPASLHYTLHKLAEDERVSIDTLILAMLSSAVAPKVRVWVQCVKTFPTVPVFAA